VEDNRQARQPKIPLLRSSRHEPEVKDRGIVSRWKPRALGSERPILEGVQKGRTLLRLTDPGSVEAPASGPACSTPLVHRCRDRSRRSEFVGSSDARCEPTSGWALPQGKGSPGGHRQTGIKDHRRTESRHCFAVRESCRKGGTPAARRQSSAAGAPPFQFKLTIAPEVPCV